MFFFLEDSLCPPEVYNSDVSKNILRTVKQQWLGKKKISNGLKTNEVHGEDSTIWKRILMGLKRDREFQP